MSRFSSRWAFVCACAIVLLSDHHNLPGHVCLAQSSFGRSVPATPNNSSSSVPCSVTRGVLPQADRANATVSCSGAPMDRSAAHAAAKTFAPVYYFHPLEQYFPMTADEYLPLTHLYNSLGEDLGNTTESLLLANSHGTDSTKFLSAERAGLGLAYRAGSSFTNGVSNAKLYYRLIAGPGGHSWIYTFFMFYPWNGCAQQMLINNPTPTAQTILQLRTCDLGVHESDWEYVQVEVCANLSTVLRIAYSQHAWSSELNCLMDRCSLSGGTHPLVYVAVDTHASYPFQSDNIVYIQPKFQTATSVEGFSLVDRTARGDKRWEVKSDGSNLVAVDPDEQRTNATYWEQQKAASPSAPDWSLGPSWITFSGRWGHSYVNAINVVNTPRCFNFNVTHLQQCPNNFVFQAAAALLGQASNPALADVIPNLAQEATNLLTGWGSLSPSTTRLFTEFREQVASPAATDGAICPNPALLVDAVPDATVASASSSGFTVTLAIGVCTLILMLILAYLTQMGRKSFWTEHPDERMTTWQQSWRDFARSLPKISLLGIFFAVFGFIIVWNGLKDSFDLLERYLPNRYWLDIERAFRAWTPVILIFDGFALVNAFFVTGKSFEFFCASRVSYCYSFVRSWGTYLQIIVIVCLFLAALVDLGILVFVSLLWGVREAFVQSCNEVESRGLSAGVCVNLSDFGFQNIFCGSDVTEFCNGWRNLDPQLTLLGTAVIILGQLFLVLMAGVHYLRMVFLKPLDIEDDETDVDRSINKLKSSGSSVAPSQHIELASNSNEED